MIKSENGHVSIEGNLVEITLDLKLILDAFIVDGREDEDLLNVLLVALDTVELDK